jgi:outer membrane protein assembly factor BamB
MGEVCAYEPTSGKLIWSCQGPAEVTGCTPACSDKLVFASGGFPEQNLLAIRADGKGDVTRSHIAWRTTRGVTYVPSPLYHDGKLFVVNDGGVVNCFDGADGTPLWHGRLAGAYSSSPVLVGERLYVTSEAGKTSVLETGKRFKVVATGDVGERVFATATVCGGRIFLRGERHLYCIGK